MGASPQRRDAINFDRFNPPDVALNWRQRAYLTGVAHNVALTNTVVLGSEVHLHRYRIGIDGTGDGDMVIAPDLNSGPYFNTQDRTTTAVEWLESLSGQRETAFGLHLYKAGLGVQRATYAATSRSRPVMVRRPDATLAESVVFAAPAAVETSSTDIWAFLQDRWPWLLGWSASPWKNSMP